MNYLSINFFFIGFLVLSGCQGNQSEQSKKFNNPHQLLLELADDRRFISTDVVADRIINDDPSLRLVDVRPAEDFQYFSLPNAINIPLKNTFVESSKDYLNFEKYTYIFYSNDDILAEQAWILNRRLGCSDCYIMKGGLNKWVETIMNPLEPPATASSEAQEQYRFRLAASRYFAGGSREISPEPFYAAPKTTSKKAVKLSTKEEEEDEGC